jgi:hypothetical protein
MSLPRFARNGTLALPKTAEGALRPETLIRPGSAWRILCRATGGRVGRATFYRWLSSGRVPSMRVGLQMFIPWPELEKLIVRCREGDQP